MSVLFDNTTSTSGLNVTSLTTPAFTITSAANRAAILGIATDGGAAPQPYAGSVGGVNGSIVSGWNTAGFASGVKAPPSGSQTATFTWNGSSIVHAVMGVATFSGVDQTTPFNNGTTTSAANSVTITSNSGDMTVGHAADVGGGTISAADQTERWLVGTHSAETSCSTGAGTGTTTHTWNTLPFGCCTPAVVIDGVNLVAAGGGGGPALVPPGALKPAVPPLIQFGAAMRKLSPLPAASFLFDAQNVRGIPRALMIRRERGRFSTLRNMAQPEPQSFQFPVQNVPVPRPGHPITLIKFAKLSYVLPAAAAVIAPPPDDYETRVFLDLDFEDEEEMTLQADTFTDDAAPQDDGLQAAIALYDEDDEIAWELHADTLTDDGGPVDVTVYDEDDDIAPEMHADTFTDEASPADGGQQVDVTLYDEDDDITWELYADTLADDVDRRDEVALYDEDDDIAWEIEASTVADDYLPQLFDFPDDDAEHDLAYGELLADDAPSDELAPMTYTADEDAEDQIDAADAQLVDAPPAIDNNVEYLVLLDLDEADWDLEAIAADYPEVLLAIVQLQLRMRTLMGVGQ